MSPHNIHLFERCSPTACGCKTEKDCPNRQPAVTVKFSKETEQYISDKLADKIHESLTQGETFQSILDAKLKESGESVSDNAYALILEAVGEALLHQMILNDKRIADIELYQLKPLQQKYDALTTYIKERKV